MKRKIEKLQNIIFEVISKIKPLARNNKEKKKLNKRRNKQPEK